MFTNITFAMAVWFSLQAQNKGVSPSKERMWTSAFDCSNFSTICLCPVLQAACNGVQPILSWRTTFAPACNKIHTIAYCPALHANRNGLHCYTYDEMITMMTQSKNTPVCLHRLQLHQLSIVSSRSLHDLGSLRNTTVYVVLVFADSPVLQIL